MPDEKLNKLDEKTWSSTSTPLEPLDDVGDLKSKINDYDYVVLYRSYGVEVVEAEEVVDETLNGALEIRAFDENGELHTIKRADGKWVGRICADKFAATEEDAVPVLDELHILWGTEAHDEDDHIVFVEDRGTRLVLPKDLSMARDVKKGSEKESSKRLALLVRNYLSAGDSFAFEDYRFVEFRIVPKEG